MSAPRSLKHLVPGLVLACLLLTTGCPVKPDHAPDRAEPKAAASAPETAWRLTPGAAVTYDFLLFEDLKRSSKSEDAAQAIHQVLERNPAPQVYLEAANYYWSKRDPATAKDLLRQGVDKFPDEWNLYLFLSSLYLTEKRPQDAALTIQDFLARKPAEPVATRAREALAQVLMESRQYAEALETLKSIPDGDRSSQTQLLTAQALSKLGHPKEAMAILKALLQKDPEILEAWAELAYLYELDNDYLAAEKAYGRILELGEAGNEVWLRLIKLNLKLKNPDKAMSLAMEAPQNVAFAQEAVTLFITEGYYDQAEALLEPWKEREDAPETLLFYQAVITSEGKKDPAGALALLERIPEGHPLYERAVHFKAHLLYSMGRKAEAMDLIEEGKKLKNPPRDLWILQSGIHEADKEYDKALAVLSEAAGRWPDDPEIMFRQGAMQERLGNRTEALAMMDKVLAVDPDNIEALNFVGYTLADSGRDLERALALVQAALRQKPDAAYIIDSLAWVHFRMGRLDVAWKEINRAAAGMKDDPTVWEHYGDIARALGRRKDAAKGYRNAIKLGSESKSRIEEKLRAL